MRDDQSSRCEHFNYGSFRCTLMVSNWELAVVVSYTDVQNNVLLHWIELQHCRSIIYKSTKNLLYMAGRPKLINWLQPQVKLTVRCTTTAHCLTATNQIEITCFSGLYFAAKLTAANFWLQIRIDMVWIGCGLFKKELRKISGKLVF
jgi:hypothetical protein